MHGSGQQYITIHYIIIIIIIIIIIFKPLMPLYLSLGP